MAHIEMNANMQYLIVDDEMANVEAMKVNLKKIGYRNFVSARSGFEAMTFIKENDTVDFVVSRLQLPDMTGIEFFDEMKNDLSINRLPFLMFSEEMDKGDLALLLEAGVDAHLTIPFVPKTLAGRVMATWSRYIDPSNIEFHFEKGRRAFMEGHHEKALEIFTMVEASGKIQQRAKVSIARVHFSQNRIDEAFSKCQELVDAYPDFVHGQQLLGELHLEKKQVVEALAAFNKALELSPKNPCRYQMISAILLGLRRWEDVKAILKAAEAQQINHNFVREGLATAFLKLDDVKKAISYYEELVERNPTVINYLNNIAVCYKKLNDLNRAIDYYNKALEVDEKDNRIRFNLALVFLAKGKEAIALKKLKEIVAMEPDHEKARLKLLQIENPEAYKAEAARIAQEKKKAAEEAEQMKQKAAEEEAKAAASAPPPNDDGDDELIQNSENVIQVDISAEEAAKLDSFLADFQVPADPASAKEVKPLALKPAVKQKIEGLSDEMVKVHYINAMKAVRRSQYKIMRSWFNSISTTSEEITSDISKIAEGILSAAKIDFSQVQEVLKSEKPEEVEAFGHLKEKFASSDALKEQVLPIIMELQFQDYLSQVLTNIEQTFKITFDPKNINDVWEKVEKVFVTQEDKSLFRKIIFNEEIPAEEENPPGEALFF